MLVSVAIEKMDNKFLAGSMAALSLVVEATLPVLKLGVIQIRQVRVLIVGKGVELEGEMVGQLCSCEDLNSFNSVDQEGAETLIKEAEVPDVIEGSLWPELVAMAFSEGEEVATQPEVARGLKPSDEWIAVGFQTSADQ